MKRNGTDEEKLVFAYGYMINFNGEVPNELPNGASGLPLSIPGYFVGNPSCPGKGHFEGLNNLRFAAAYASRLSRDLSTLVDMDFEGIAKDDLMTVLLQPIQEDPDNYKSMAELAREHSFTGL